MEERNHPQPVNPWLKSDGASLQDSSEPSYCKELGETDLPKLRRAKSILAKRQKRRLIKEPKLAAIPEEPQEVVESEESQTVVPEEPKEAAVNPEEPQSDGSPEEVQAGVNDCHDKTDPHHPKEFTEQVMRKPYRILQRGSDASPQRAPKAEAGDWLEVFSRQTGVKMVVLSELDVMTQNDEEMEQLRRENAALRSEIERLKEMFRAQEALNAQAKAAQSQKIKMLQQELAEAETSDKELLLRVSKLEEALTETQRNEEKDEVDSLLAALVQAEEDQKRKRQQWEEEKARLLQLTKEEEQQECGGQLRDKRADLEEKTVPINEEPKQKKPSLWKRFLMITDCNHT